MVALTMSTLERWQPGEQVEVHEEMLGLSAQIATSILFGQDAWNDEYQRSPEQIAEAAWALVASPLTQLAPYDLPGLPYRRYLDLIAIWDRQMREIIFRKRDSGAQGDDVLSALITAEDEDTGVSLTEDELVGHVGSIFGAAHETVASALTWIFLRCVSVSVCGGGPLGRVGWRAQGRGTFGRSARAIAVP
jgi:cytochrome P450